MTADLAWLVKPLEWHQASHAGQKLELMVAHCPVLDKRYYAENGAVDIPKQDAKHRARVLAMLNTEAVAELVRALQSIEMLTSTGDGLSPTATINVNLMAHAALAKMTEGGE